MNFETNFLLHGWTEHCRIRIQKGWKHLVPNVYFNCLISGFLSKFQIILPKWVHFFSKQEYIELQNILFWIWIIHNVYLNNKYSLPMQRTTLWVRYFTEKLQKNEIIICPIAIFSERLIENFLFCGQIIKIDQITG